MIKLGIDETLPTGWKWVSAQDVIDVRDGTHDSPKYIAKGIPLVTSKNLDNGKINFDSCQFITQEDHDGISKRSKVDDGDILYAMIGTVGNPVIVEKKTDFSIKNVALFKFDGKNIYNRFFYHFLNDSLVKIQFEKNKRGGTQKFISLGNLRKLQIPLPPLPEQKRIAAILDKADAIRRKRQQAIDLADQYLRSVFLDMFGDPVTNPKGWEVKKLKDLTIKIGSGSTPRGGKNSYISKGISLIRSLNIHDNKFVYKDLAHINEDQAEKLKNVILEKDDVLLNITGASVCRCVIVPSKVLPARVNQHVCIIRVNKKSINSIYFQRLLTSYNYKRKLLNIATSSGATREALTKDQVENLLIPCPPKELQNKFEQILVKANSILKSHQIFEKKSNIIFSSLSQQAFAGKL